MGSPYLLVDGLSKHYEDKTVLDIENLTINRGEVLAVIGPNGSGKSTLLRLIAHLEEPVAGSIRLALDKGSISDLDIRRRMAVVFQEPLLFSGTVLDNITYGLKLRKIPKPQIDQKVRVIADMFGIAHLLDRPSNKISGGEAQRVSFARALVLEPELLLLDEPMASLDPPTRESLLVDLCRILDELEMTAIYVTHELTEAIILADCWVVMDEGKIVQTGTPQEVMAYPVNKKIADFVGVENILKGEITGHSDGLARIKIRNVEIEAVDGVNSVDDVWVFIRPENIVVETEEFGKKTSVRNRFAGEIERMLDVGAFYRVIVDCGFPLAVFVTKRSVEEMGLKLGQRVWTSFKATGVHVVPRN